MHICRRETFAGRERFRTRSDRFSNKCPSLFVKPGLIFNRLQHKCVRRFIRCFGCSHDPSLEV